MGENQRYRYGLVGHATKHFRCRFFWPLACLVSLTGKFCTSGGNCNLPIPCDHTLEDSLKRHMESGKIQCYDDFTFLLFDSTTVTHLRPPLYLCESSHTTQLQAPTKKQEAASRLPFKQFQRQNIHVLTNNLQLKQTDQIPSQVMRPVQGIQHIITTD